jgi:DNA repair protein SbcD/Mre11
MKLLHTSDWHLDRAFYSRKRYDECEAFLNWLAALI